ncbi:MAG: glycosyltransferase [Candidatus Cloacimonetes bacterium]|nr:glycosyltransferase [Candidatus Cloacimonadota bacterium]
MFLIFFFLAGILRLKRVHDPRIKKLSIIVAARNEEKYLPELLDRLLNQNYPEDAYEMIIIDDRSTDETAGIIRKYQQRTSQIRFISIEDYDPVLSGKKKALAVGIDYASNEILVFTDADCLPGRNWLQEINRHFSDQIDFLAGYSPLQIKNGLLSVLKNLERVSLFAVTAGSFGWKWGITCTARNMAYRKSIFNKINGFEGIGQIPSGDDDLLLQKMAGFLRKLTFMFTTTSFVPARDRTEWKIQINQESRRASKWRYYPLPVKAMTLFIFSYYLSIFLAVTLTFFSLLSWQEVITLIILKTVPEFLLLACFLIKVKKCKLLWGFLIAEVIYIPYFIFFAVKGTWGRYSWKD